MSYVVTAPLVLARDQEGRVHHCYEGAVIPWLSDEQAEHLVGLGMVVKVDDEPADDGEDADEEPADDGMPLRAAPKADWVAYVAAKTADTDTPVTAEEADALTKQELIEQYG